MDAKEFKLQYRFVTYFLKELGLWHKWNDYLKKHKKEYNPEAFPTIDCVFGFRNFTSYLKIHNIRLKYGATISEWFRAFLVVYVGKTKGMAYPPDKHIITAMQHYYKIKNFKEIIEKYE